MEEKDANLDALSWALKFMQEYEKKLMQRAVKIAKSQRKEKQYGLIRQTYFQKSQE